MQVGRYLNANRWEAPLLKHGMAGLRLPAALLVAATERHALLRKTELQVQRGMGQMQVHLTKRPFVLAWLATQFRQTILVQLPNIMLRNLVEPYQNILNPYVLIQKIISSNTELLSSYERAQEKRLFEVYIFNALFTSLRLYFLITPAAVASALIAKLTSFRKIRERKCSCACGPRVASL
ncbi:hypothetical protein A7309_25975 [Paenibacillus polymyxa]|nr:hypothetical protein A7309_25975 [Paenibacillus polymyxa]